MSDRSEIEWTNATWNPIRGCIKVSPVFKQWGGTQKKKTGRMLDGRTWDEMPAGLPAHFTQAGREGRTDHLHSVTTP